LYNLHIVITSHLFCTSHQSRWLRWVICHRNSATASWRYNFSLYYYYYTIDTVGVIAVDVLPIPWTYMDVIPICLLLNYCGGGSQSTDKLAYDHSDVLLYLRGCSTHTMNLRGCSTHTMNLHGCSTYTMVCDGLSAVGRASGICSIGYRCLK